MTPSPRLTLFVAAGGAAGGLLRHGIEAWAPVGPHAAGFWWTTMAINVLGAFLLALLPAIGRVRRSPAWTVAFGPGLLGGFTTLSAVSEQARMLLAEERAGAAAAYVVGTLVACLVAVLLAATLSARSEQDDLALAGGDE